MDCSPPGTPVHGILQATILKWVAISFSRGLKLGLLHCRQILYHLSHQKSLRSTGVSSHSLLHSIFPTQGLNLGLPHCRQILYYLSHQEALYYLIEFPYNPFYSCKVGNKVSSLILDFS